MKFFVVIEKGNPGEENYGAFCPDLPGCGTTGETLDETLVHIKEAIELYLEGESLPHLHNATEITSDIEFNAGEILTSVEVDIQPLKIPA